MITLWIVLGNIFFTGLGIRFVYKAIGLTKAEAVIIYLLIIGIVALNSAPTLMFLSMLM